MVSLKCDFWNAVIQCLIHSVKPSQALINRSGFITGLLNPVLVTPNSHWRLWNESFEPIGSYCSRLIPPFEFTYTITIWERGFLNSGISDLDHHWISLFFGSGFEISFLLLFVGLLIKASEPWFSKQWLILSLQAPRLGSGWDLVEFSWELSGGCIGAKDWKWRSELRKFKYPSLYPLFPFSPQYT